MTNTIQKKFKVSSTQLLYQSCPYQAIVLVLSGPFLDGLLTDQNVFAFNYTPQVLVTQEENHLHSPCQLLNFPAKNLNFPFVSGIHRSLLPAFGLSKFQHISCDWKDVSSHIPGSRASEDVPSPRFWVHSSS